MATLNTDNPTLLDMAKRMDPNGAIANIVEALQPKSALLQDATFVEGNLATGHTFTLRTALPSVAFRKFNEGITPGKSKTDQLTETAGSLEGMAVVDQALAKLNGNMAAFRSSEDKGFLISINKTAEDTVFYGDTLSTPEKFKGFAPRLDSTTLDQAGSQIIKADASASGSDQTSIYVIGWSPDTVALFTPKGVAAGLTPQDLGLQLWDDGTGKKFPAYVTHWRWQLGLMVKDWRYVVRIANIDTSALSRTGTTILDALNDSITQMESLDGVRVAIYMNRTSAKFLRAQAQNYVKGGNFTMTEMGGRWRNTWDGIPLNVTDSILNTEAVIS